MNSAQTVEERARLEEAIRFAEANVKLEGFDPYQHPLFASLKERLLAGEITPEQMTEEVIAYASSKRLVTTAA